MERYLLRYGKWVSGREGKRERGTVQKEIMECEQERETYRNRKDRESKREITEYEEREEREGREEKEREEKACNE